MLLSSCPLDSQISQINTGTFEDLFDLSIISKKILVSSSNTYMASSVDECQHLNQKSKPSSISFFNRCQRLDLDDLFLFSYTVNQTLIYYTSDCGGTFVSKCNMNGAISREFGFNDALAGFMSDGKVLYKTTNGGLNWNINNYYPPFYASITKIRTFGDSLICLGGLNLNGSSVVFSTNRGSNWKYGTFNLSGNITDINYLNKDTFLLVTDINSFVKTTDAGNSWDINSPLIPLKNSYKINFKNYKEIYVVGIDKQNNGSIAKTTDLGNTWSVYSTGIQTTLYNIAFLNDSIAFLSGSNGVLLRWNYKQTIFTGLKENEKEQLDIKIFPNPSKNKLSFTGGNIANSTFSLIICNMIGQVLLSKEAFKLEDEIDISYLQDGIYYLKIQNDGGQKICKFLKE